MLTPKTENSPSILKHKKKNALWKKGGKKTKSSQQKQMTEKKAVKRVHFNLDGEKAPVNKAKKNIKKEAKFSNTDAIDSKPKLINKNKKKNLKNKNTKAKTLKRKHSEGSTGDAPAKKIKLCDMKKKDRKVIRKQNEDNKYELNMKLKLLWEELRKDETKPERKLVLSGEICKIISGKAIEFTFAHDTVRVLECVLICGSPEHRTLLYEELKTRTLSLAKSKYGKFFVMKMLRYGTRPQRNEILKSFHGHVIELMNHTEAAEVVEAGFNECANAAQRNELMQEFYGPSYKYFKTTSESLKNIFESEQKSAILKHMKDTLLRMLEKSVVKHSLVHFMLLQFFSHCDEESRAEVIESLRTAVPEILHTRDGSRVAMQCVWHGTVKDRKVIIKQLKTFVCKAAMEEHGHMVLLALFDCVDDTKLVGKHIIGELIKDLLNVSKDLHGKKVLAYLLSPRDTHFFHPDIIKILRCGDENKISKKDSTIRQAELHNVIAKPLLDLIQRNIPTLYKDNSYNLFVVTVLKYALGDKQSVFETIVQLASKPYTKESKNVHPIEYPGSHFLLKQLIIHDKVKMVPTTLFSEVLVNKLPEGSLKSWINCNRGAFLLVHLLETESPSVVNKVHEEMKGLNKELAKKSYKGAEILLKKLKMRPMDSVSIPVSA